MKFNLIIFLTLFIGLASCKKSNLKKPTKISFSFSAVTQNSSIINIQSTHFSLSQMTVEGKRIEGEDIKFDRELTNPLLLTLDGTTTNDALNFDIPQGEYTELKVDLSNSESTLLEPSVNIEGKYKLTTGPTVDVIFEMPSKKTFTMLVENTGQNNTISLDTKIDRTINITLNITQWLSSLTENDLDNADLIIGNSGQGLGNSTILINSTNNINLYTKVINQMNTGNTAIIN